VKFAQHIGKGAWGFGSKLMPAIYGVVTVLIIKALVKSEYGELFLFQNIFGMIFTFSDNFALQAIIKFGVEPGSDLHELISAVALLFFGFLAIVLGIIAIFPMQIGELINSPSLPIFVPSLIILVIVTIPRVIASRIFVMRFHTKDLFIVDAINFGGASIAIVILALMDKLSTAQEVINITIIAGATSSLVAIILARHERLWHFKYSRASLKKIFEFTRYQSATGAVHVLQQNLDGFLVSGFIGVEAVADYGAAKIFFRGFDVLRDTQGIFVFPAASKYYARGEMDTLKKIIEKATSFLYLLMIPLTLLLVVFAPQIFHLLYGTKYDASVPIFRILMSCAIVLPVVMVGMAALVGMGKVREVFRIIVVSLTVNTLLAILLLSSLGTHGAAVSFCAAMMIQAILVFVVMKRELPLEFSAMLTRGIGDAKYFIKDRRRK
jgi:teichuronic acid exporter